MKELTQLSLDEFLNRVAERTPTPGGGSVAAASGTMACALARMVTAYSIGKNTEAESRAKLEETLAALRGLDELMRALVTHDAKAYEDLTSAAKTMKSENSAEARVAYQSSLLAGLAVPMEIAAVASRILALLDASRERMNPRLFSDLGASAALAEASAQAAGFTVQANLSEVENASIGLRIRGELDAILRHCGDAHRSIEAFVRTSLERT